MPPELQIDRIHQKLNQLLKQFALIQKQNAELSKELQSLRRQRDQQLQVIDELEQKILFLKASKSDLNPEEKKLLEKKLTSYMKEIDRCIAILSE